MLLPWDVVILLWPYANGKIPRTIISVNSVDTKPDPVSLAWGVAAHHPREQECLRPAQGHAYGPPVVSRISA